MTTRELSHLLMPVPPVPKQRKIAEILSIWGEVQVIL